MADSWFTLVAPSRLPRPDRIAEQEPSRLSFTREPLAAPPAPFSLPAWEHRGRYPPIPRAAKVKAAPMQVQYFVGRVQEWPEPAPSSVTAILWQWPSGREFVASLSVKSHFHGERPREGASIDVWSWLECSGVGQTKEQLHARVRGRR